MFGHDNQNDQTQTDNQSSATPVISPAPDELVNGTDDSQGTTAPGAPTPAFDTANSAPGSSVDEPAASTPSSSSEDHDDVLPSHGGSVVDDDLLNIKQDALQQLTPLVGHLDQSPEEKFRTTMMMIQASDDQSLVKTAYDAAKEIKDDKARAQALLDIINEINYFTQQQNHDLS